MKTLIQLTSIALLTLLLGNLSYAAKGPKDNMIDGERYPDGYTPMPIKNGKYPRR